MDDKILKLLYDIQRCISKIETYTVGQTLENYLTDEKTQDAVERNFEIIGEAINQISKINASIAEQINESGKIVGFRNYLIHSYDTVSDYITWDIVENKLPTLKTDIRQLMDT